MARTVYSVNQDGWEIDVAGSGAVDLTSSTNQVGDVSSAYGFGAFRFTSVNIAQGATINHAVFRLYIGTVTTSAMSIFAACEAADNSSALTTAAGNISGRTRTSTKTYYLHDLNDGYVYLDFTAQLQEVINRAGWVSGNAVTLIVYGTTASLSSSSFVAYNSESANDPELYVVTGGSATASFYPTVSGTGTWVNPNNAFSDNGVNATVDNSTNAAQIWESFGITGVTGTVDSILIKVEGFVTSTSTRSQFKVELSWDGGTSWTAAKYSTQLQTAVDVHEFGGADAWNHTFTPSELSNANFKVRVSCDLATSTNDARIDYVKANVFYTPVSGYTLTAAQGTFSLTGQATALIAARKLVSAQGSFSLTGQTTNFRKGYTLSASQASFSLSGQTAIFQATRKLTAAQGSYALTGQSTALKAGRKLSADQASFTLTGQNTLFTKGFRLTASSGVFSLTGQALNFLRGLRLTANQASFTLTGQTANLVKSYVLQASQATFNVTGQTASLIAARLLTASQSSFALTGQPTRFLRGLVFSLEHGVFTLAGQAISFAENGVLTAVYGTFSVAGQSANLTIGRILIAESGNFVLTGQDISFSQSQPQPTVIPRRMLMGVGI